MKSMIKGILDPQLMEKNFTEFRVILSSYDKYPTITDANSRTLSNTCSKDLISYFTPLGIHSMNWDDFLQTVQNFVVADDFHDHIENALAGLSSAKTEKDLSNEIHNLLSEVLPADFVPKKEVSSTHNTLLFGKYTRVKSDMVLLSNGDSVVGTMELKAEGELDHRSFYQALGYVVSIELPSRLNSFGTLPDALTLVLSPASCFALWISSPPFHSGDSYQLKYFQFELTDHKQAATIIAYFIHHSISLSYTRFVAKFEKGKLVLNETERRVRPGVLQDSLFGRGLPSLKRIEHPGLRDYTTIPNLSHGILLFCTKDELLGIRGELIKGRNSDPDEHSLKPLDEGPYVVKVICSFYGIHHHNLAANEGMSNLSLLFLLTELQHEPRIVPERIFGEKPKKYILDSSMSTELKLYRSDLKKILQRSLYQVIVFSGYSVATKWFIVMKDLSIHMPITQEVSVEV
eukprot:GHVR01030534.1.p1 GENE.GHVR01030534.1~~GHVR01030534.1.p1  ORF type:complete len:460 (+),score=0.05 GHVR01030534.1:75-1454(+)